MDSLRVERAVIGLFFSGVKLSNGEGGICFTPVKEIPESVCCPTSAAAIPAAGKLKNKPVSFYLEGLRSGKALKKALGIAVLNALSATCWRKNPPQDYSLIYGKDPLDDATVPDDAQFVVVGALAPYLKMLKARGRPFSILEKDTRTLKKDELQFYVGPAEAMTKIAAADWLIITGTTLINDTLEDILAATKPGAEIIVVGPTASMLPDAFFRRGVSAIGGIIATHADELLDTLVEAGSGYHFFGKSAEKIIIRMKESAHAV
jgi:uncharacterized protein (DUF4213/DUF364 family)